MYIDLIDVLRSPGNAVERSINLPPTMLDDLELVEPVSGVVRVENARQSVVVSGHATTAVKLQCARCLQDYAQSLELEFEAVAPISFLKPDGDGKIEESEEADDELAALFASHAVDVWELVRQAVILQAPIQPLCGEDCRGLPEWSRYSEARDERWAALGRWDAPNTNGKGS